MPYEPQQIRIGKAARAIERTQDYSQGNIMKHAARHGVSYKGFEYLVTFYREHRKNQARRNPCGGRRRNISDAEHRAAMIGADRYVAFVNRLKKRYAKDGIITTHRRGKRTRYQKLYDLAAEKDKRGGWTPKANPGRKRSFPSRMTSAEKRQYIRNLQKIRWLQKGGGNKSYIESLKNSNFMITADAMRRR